MDPEGRYSQPHFSANRPSQNMSSTRQRMASANTRSSNKRKRGNQDDAQQLTGIGGAPTAAMGDTHNGNFFNQAPQDSNNDDPNGEQFDLSALQAQNQSTGPNVGDNGNVDTAAAALTQHYSMTVPPHPAETFLAQPTIGADHSYGDMDQAQEYAPDGDISGSGLLERKPDVGSDEWHKQRRDNHKEVERRRRETINEGINELAKIVPGAEKAKGAILQRACQYIQRLHTDASENIDKWTFEKLVTEQAINDLSSKLHRSYAERDAWKRIAKQAGVDIENVDLGLEDIPVNEGLAKAIHGQKDGQIGGENGNNGDQSGDAL